MTEVAASAKKKIQVSVEEGGVAEVTINGTKVAEISPDGNIVTFKETQLAKPAATTETAAKKGTSIDIGEAFNTVAMYGATVEAATDGSLIVYTNGKVFTKPAPANDTTIAAAKAALEISQRMDDGTIFAGISPDTNKPMYAASADEPLPLTFNKAKERAKDKSSATGKAYRVPSANELNVMFNNRAAIGGFNLTGFDPSGLYWSSSPHYGLFFDDCARIQRFSDGSQSFDSKSVGLAVRLVRS